MDFVPLDKVTYFPLGIAEVYTSGIWTERYREAGDFELRLPVNTPIIKHMSIGNYLNLHGSDRTMIIENMEIDTDETTGEKTAIFTGESLESLLKRRIVWEQTLLKGNLIDQVEYILLHNIGSLASEKRRISNFRFVRPEAGTPEYEYLNSISITCQFTGDNLYDVIKELSEECDFGWKITLSASGMFEFRFILGTNRTYNADPEIDPIIFSPEFENLRNSKFVYGTSAYKNITLVLGEDDGQARRRKVVWTEDSEPEGIDRKELYTDARDLQSEREDGTTMSDEDYMASLEARGKKKLAETAITTAFDGEIEPGIGPKYGRDFFLGDYVSTMNEFGIGTAAQISEFIRSSDVNGYNEYPTFIMLN